MLSCPSTLCPRRSTCTRSSRSSSGGQHTQVRRCSLNTSNSIRVSDYVLPSSDPGNQTTIPVHSDQPPPPDHLNPAFLDSDFDARFNKAFPKATIRKIWKALKDAVDTSSDGRKPAEKKVSEAWVSRSLAFNVTQTYTAHR